MTEYADELKTNVNFDWCLRLMTKSTEKNEKMALVGVKKRAFQRNQKKFNNEIKVLKRLNELDPIAASGIKNHVVSPTLVDNLMDYVKSEDFSSNNTISAINFIRKIVLFGNNELGWNSPIPQPAIKLRNYQNPVTVDKFSSLAKISTEIASFKQYLLDTDFKYVDEDKEITNEDLILVWGITICSLIIFSACLDYKCLVSLIQGEWTIKRLRYVWIDVHANSDQSSRLIRIFPDPISLIFLQKIYKKKLFKSFKNNNDSSAWLNNAIKRLRSELAGTICGSVYEWRSSMELWHQIHLPAQILELAKGNPKTTAMEAHAWHRTLIAKPIHQEYIPLTKEKQFKAEFSSYTKRSSSKSSVGLSSAETYKRLKQILSRKHEATFNKSHIENKKKRKQECVSELNKLLAEVNQFSDIKHAVVSWLIYKLTTSTSKIDISSAYQYLTSFCSSMMKLLEEDDLGLIDDEIYESVYIDLIQQVNSNNSKMAKMQLIVQFHRFLMLNFGATSINFDNLPEFNGDIGAKAHFITVDEFVKAKELIKSTTSNRNDVAYFIMILCYRCGLRISEAINLLMNDIHFPSLDLLFTDCAITITIKPNHHRSLKSTNAIRQLPLHLLLDTSELLEFKQFIAEQYKVKNSKTDLLFHSNFSLNNPIEKSEICKIIVNTLREVTSDHEITVHQLRHSFCCLIFQLIFTDLDVTPLPNHWINGNHPVDVNLKDLLLRHTAYSRSPIYQVAEWMGHYSPLMSLSAYMHWGHLPVRQKLDAILKEKNKCNALIKKIVCKLLGITNENLKLKLHKKDQNLHDTVASVIKVPRLEKTQAYIKKSKVQYESKDVLLSDFSFKHWTIYFQVLSKLHDIDKAESFLGIEPGQTHNAINLLKKFSDRSKRNSAYQLFPGLSKKNVGYAEKLTLLEKLQIIIPAQPKRKDIYIAEEVYSLLDKEIKLNPDLIIQPIKSILRNYKHYENTICFKSNEDINEIASFEKILEKTTAAISTPKINDNNYWTSPRDVVISLKPNKASTMPYGFIFSIILISLKHCDLVFPLDK